MERSILFSSTMAKAILADKKTVTRRTITARSPPECPYGPTGTHLWVKEDFYAYGRWESRPDSGITRAAWHFIDMTLQSGQSYQYTTPEGYNRQHRAKSLPTWWYRPGRLMPRKASRTTLEVTDVHTEKLHDITDEQAQAEGFYPIHDSVHVYFANHLPAPHTGLSPTPVIAFATWWQRSQRELPWSENPEVWVISFRRLH